MRLAVLTFGSRETASTKYRIVSYLSYFKRQGWVIDLIQKHDLSKKETWEILRNADVIINQKCLISTRIGKKIFALGKPILFDIDDAIYTRTGKSYGWLTRIRINRRMRFWFTRSHRILVANHFLADAMRQFNSQVTLLPMGLDLEEWKPSKKSAADSTITIGWAGAPNNIPLLESLNSVFEKVKAKHPQVELAIFSGAVPNLSVPFTHVPFKPGKEASFTQKLDIGLLPLVDDEGCQSKSPIKAIQYLACSVPVIGNRFGATNEILNDENSLAVLTEQDWLDAIDLLIADREKAQQIGRKGRAFVLNHHNRDQLANDFLEIIESVQTRLAH